MAISPAYPSHPAGSPGRWRGAVAQGDVGTRAQDHAADDRIVRGEEAHNRTKHRYAPLAGGLAPPLWPQPVVNPLPGLRASYYGGATLSRGPTLAIDGHALV